MIKTNIFNIPYSLLNCTILSIKSLLLEKKFLQITNISVKKSCLILKSLITLSGIKERSQ